MRVSPMTMVDLLAVPVAVAAEIAFIQSMHDWTYLDWGLMIVQIPFCTIELGVLIKIGLELWRKGESGPFLFGFAATGPAVIIFVHLVLLEFHGIDAFQYFASGWIWNLSGGGLKLGNTAYFQSMLKITSCLMLILPQCLFAVLGGLLARRLGLTIIRKRRLTSSLTDPELVSSEARRQPS